MNLDKIRKKVYDGISNENPCHDFTIACMREAVQQALELATERAEVIINEDIRNKELFLWEEGSEDPSVCRVDKQSILDIMEEIE